MTPLATYTFAQPWWFLALLVVIPTLFIAGRRGLTSSITFSSLGILASLAERPRKNLLGIHLTFLFLALVSGIIALARPQHQTTYSFQKTDGIDIVIALDLSYSMIIDDFYPNDDRTQRPIMRLDAAKGVLKTFIDSRPSDRIGIVAFSGRPYSLSPITLDHSWLHNRLNAVQLGDIKEQGTAIGSAIAASSTRLTDRDATSKVVILITDGASNSGNIEPVEAAELAAKLGIKIYTIAIGTEEGRVPATIQRFPKQEFDIPTLTEIANLTNGEFYRARSISDLQNTFDTINKLERPPPRPRTPPSPPNSSPGSRGSLSSSRSSLLPNGSSPLTPPHNPLCSFSLHIGSTSSSSLYSY